MIIKRIIPCLLIKDEGLVKTKKFSNPKYVGDPINAVKIFNDKEADEIIILDIEATNKNFINFDLISRIFGESFVPITYGGGIKSLEDAKKIINLGAEKICIQSCFFENKNLVLEMVNFFGSQAVVLAIDIKKNIFGSYKIWDYKNNKFYKNLDLTNISNLAGDLGVGEIIFTDVDREGTLQGTNKYLINKLCKNSIIPAIYNGGIKDINDIKLSFKSGTQAIAAGSFFVFYGKHKAVLISYPSEEIKNLINYEL
tara:strand:- start:140 stop:904 length:765 start_codon:yes stop_codon:yes gene_type:complete